MKISYRGRQVEAKEVDFEISKENFNEYQLLNGDVIKFKTVVTSIHEIVDEKEPNGDPIYNIQSTNIVVLKRVDKS